MESSGVTKQSWFNAFCEGFSLPWESAGLLLKTKGVKRIAALPLLVNAILYILALTLFFYLLHTITVSDVAWDFWGPTGEYLSKSLNAFGWFVKWVIGVPIALIICYYSFTTVGMVVGSPFNDMLSDRLENAICQEKSQVKLGWKLTVHSLLWSLVDTLWIVMRQAFWSVLCLPLLLIPGVGFIPLLLVTGYFTGLGFFDVGMARNMLRNKHKTPALRLHRWRIFGFGLAMELLFLIPLFGLLLMPIGVSGGTLIYCRTDWKSIFEENQWAYPTGFLPPVLKP